MTHGLFAIPTAGQKSIWSEMSLGSAPWQLATQLPNKRPVMVLTEDVDQALRIQEALSFYQPELKTAFFPDWETLAYERFSPHQDLVSERLAVLWQLKNQQIDMVLLPVATAMQKLSPLAFIQGRTFWLKVGEALNDEQFKAQLVDAG